MALLQLPLDILDDIVQATMPEGFEAWMLTCKMMHKVGHRFLDKYNTLTRTWNHVDLANRGSEVKNIADLLLRVIDNPKIAPYIMEARLWTGRGFRFSNDRLPHKDKLDQLWADQCTKMDVEALDLGMLERAPDLDDFRQEEFEGVRCVRSAIILLTLLPNIRTLDLPFEWKCCKPLNYKHDGVRSTDQLDLWGVLDQLVSASNEDPSRRSFPSLKRLSYIESAGYDLGDSHLGFRCLMPFLAMPQITELYASSLRLVDDAHAGVAFGDWTYPKYDSNLQKIELANCCMDASIEKFLSHVPNLEVFKYSHEYKWLGCQYEWSAGEFVSVVGKCCGSSIVELAITIDDPSNGCIVTGVTSLQEFKKLQHLELDTLVFLAGVSHTPADSPENIKWKVEQIPPLTQILPPSVQTLTLRSSTDSRIGGVFDRLFGNFVAHKADTLPSLRSVVLEQDHAFNALTKLQKEDIPRACESKGIECRFSESAHAPWRRDFAQQFPRVESECGGCWGRRQR